MHFNWFSKCYEKMMQWALHRHAEYYLMALSFMESSFFPIPPDFMLAPMALARPKKAWYYAAITTIASACGALLGYLIGACAFVFIQPLLYKLGYQATYHQITLWFLHWGVLMMFVAAFTPIPFKLFTIAAGVLHMAILPFFLISLLGRGARFFLVAALLHWGGEPMEKQLRRWIDWIGWVFLACIAVLVVIWY